MALNRLALGMIEVATGPFDLSTGPSLGGIIDHKGSLPTRADLMLLENPTRQLAAEAAPTDVLASQEIVEDAGLALQDLTQFGAEAGHGFEGEQRPNQQGVGLFPVFDFQAGQLEALIDPLGGEFSVAFIPGQFLLDLRD